MLSPMGLEEIHWIMKDLMYALLRFKILKPTELRFNYRLQKI